MKDWLSVNGKTIGRVIGVIVLYVIAKKFPQAQLEWQTVEQLLEITGLLFVGLAPGLRSASRRDDE